MSKEEKTGNKRFARLSALLFGLVFFGLILAATHFSGAVWWGYLILIAIGAACVLIRLTPHIRIPFIIRLLVALLTPAASFLLMESMTHVVWDTMTADVIALNLIFYYLLYFFLFFATGRSSVSLTIATVFVMIAGIANYFVIMFRSSPILPWDFLSLKTAMSVADNYEFSIDWSFACLCGALLLLIVLGLRTSMRMKQPLLRAALFAVLMVPSYFYVSFLFTPDIADSTGLDDTLFTPRYMFRTNGFFVAFLMDLRYLQVNAPDGYSEEAALTILDAQEVEETTVSDPEELPTILVIMNEAFSDPAVLGDFETNVEYMPFVHSILGGQVENTISGHLYVSVLGGNTANSEFEFLTGDSMAFLPTGSVPYQQYIHSSLDTIVSQLSALGYQSTAMHPYNASGWNRETVYQLMGFDSLLFYPDFVNKVKLRKYVSDASDYENVLLAYDSTDTPQLIFNVTMQNHSGYGDSYDNFTPEVEALFSNTSSNRYLNNYLSLMKVADEAISDLIAELAQSDKPTYVVFFGDHQANDYVVKPIYQEQGLDIENQTLKQQQQRQIVPFFIWTNQEIEEQTDVSISLNYLNTLLFETASLPLNEYQTFLSSMRETIPVINALGYFDTDGICHTFEEAEGETANLLQQYEILQYHHLFD